MRAADLAKEIDRCGLYRMRDGRPVEAQQIHARVGHYPDDFGRDGTFIKLIWWKRLRHSSLLLSKQRAWWCLKQ